MLNTYIKINNAVHHLEQNFFAYSHLDEYLSAEAINERQSDFEKAVESKTKQILFEDGVSVNDYETYLDSDQFELDFVAEFGQPTYDEEFLHNINAALFA